METQLRNFPFLLIKFGLATALLLLILRVATRDVVGAVTATGLLLWNLALWRLYKNRLK